RIAVVGCGGISYAHLRGYENLQKAGLGDFTISAVCDVDEGRARKFADDVAKFQEGKRPECFADVESLLKAGAADAVDICTSVAHHHQIALMGIEHGLHATMEKPFTITIRAGREVVDAAEVKGVVCSVSENWRFMPAFQRAKWLIDDGRIGDFRSVMYGLSGRDNCFPNKVVGNTPWRHQKLIAGAGAIFDVSSHDFAVLRTLCNEIDRVSGATLVISDTKVMLDESGAVLSEHPNNVDDVGFALLYFRNGGMGMLAQGWGGHGVAGKVEGWMTIQGTEGSINSDSNSGTLFLDDKSSHDIEALFNENAPEEVRESCFPKGITDSFALELHDWIQAIRHARRPVNHGSEGLRDIAVSYGVIESSLLRETVSIEDILSGKVANYQKEIDDHWGLL
ncbi:MAG: Gfo/Idh/MocA family oxidoreductase, partial [Planctomycetota bacterium]|nr:Gfo/Idh/MocA family oxidoreductase [Planctomycetota bacterium]